MPSIIPWVLDDDGSGTSCANDGPNDDSSTSSSPTRPPTPTPSPAVMHPYVECADGCRIGPVETISFLCPRRDVCSGHRNLRWLRLVLYIMPSYSQVLGDARQQASIERMMYDFWANDGGLFIGRSSPHLIVLNRNRSLNLIRGYLRGRFPLPRLRLILEVSSESSPTTNAPSVITCRRRSQDSWQCSPCRIS